MDDITPGIVGAVLTPEYIKDKIPVYKVKNSLRSGMPPSLDLRKTLTPIRNQYGTSLCVPFSLCAGLEYIVQQGSYFSPQFIYDQRSLSLNGMTVAEALELAKVKGICTENSYEFNVQHNGITKELYTEASQFKISPEYFRISDIMSLKQAMCDGKAILITFPVYNKSTKFWKKEANDKFLGYHCVMACGFTETSVLLRNSWGNTWGNEGYSVDFKYGDWDSVLECWAFSGTGNYPPMPKPKCLQSCKCIIL